MLNMLRQLEANPEMKMYYTQMQELAESASTSVFLNFGEECDPAEVFYRTYGFIYRESTKVFKQHPAQQCKKGCNACCHLRVSSSVPEVAALHYWMRKNLSESQRAEIYCAIRECGYTSKQLLKTMPWIEKQKKCVFLQNENCAIYKFRPLACRGMNSLDSKLCYEGYNERKHLQFPMNGTQKFVYEGLATGIDKSIKLNYERRCMQVELHQTLLHVAQNATAVDDWLAGSDEFKQYEVFLEL